MARPQGGRLFQGYETAPGPRPGIDERPPNCCSSTNRWKASIRLAASCFRNILRRAHDRGTTLFVNSHLLTEVEMVCDQVAILHGGRVVESGVLSELTSREREYRVTVASNLDQVPQVLDSSVDAIEEGKAPEGLAAWHLTVHDREQLNAAPRPDPAGGHLDRRRRTDAQQPRGSLHSRLSATPTARRRALPR